MTFFFNMLGFHQRSQKIEDSPEYIDHFKTSYIKIILRHFKTKALNMGKVCYLNLALGAPKWLVRAW